MRSWQPVAATTKLPGKQASQGFLLMLLMAWLFLVAPAAAQEPTFTLESVLPDSLSQSTTTGQTVNLNVIKKIDGQGVAGEQVDWLVSGQGTARVSTASSNTAKANDLQQAGIASTSFAASSAGSYQITASSNIQPGCRADDCAKVSLTFTIIVSSPGSGRSSGGPNYELIGVGAAAAAMIAAASYNNDDNRPAPPEQVSRAISLVSGDGQSGFANSALLTPLVVRALDNGLPAGGITINWSANGGATLSSGSSVSDSSGNASILVSNLGPGPGPITVTARRADSSTSLLSFTLLVSVPTLDKVSGDNQSAFTGATLANPLVVEARLSGSPQAGLGIIWSVLSGNATISSVSSGGTTNSLGQSAATIQIGSTAGNIQIKAARADRPTISQTFTLTALQARTLSRVSGNLQTGPTDTTLPNPLVVLAQTNGLAAAGVTINWTVSGSATLSASSSVTNGGGNASIDVTFGASPGTVTVTGTRADDATAQVSFTLTSTLIRTLLISSGNNQSAPINGAISNPLVVLARNNGLIKPGVTINWTASGTATLSASSSVTDALGQASVMVTSIGSGSAPVLVTGARAEEPLVKVIFNMTIIPSALTIVSGSGQSGLIGSPADLPLVVSLQDGLAVAVAGQTISWSVIGGSASLGASSSVTNASGQASVSFSFGNTASPITIRASAYSGLVSVNFSATPTNATGLTIISGNGQSAAAGVTLPIAFVVSVDQIVLRSGGSPDALSGVPVNFTVLSGSAQILSTSGVTNAIGQASAVVKLGLTPGPVSVRAQVPGGPSVLFSATVTGSLVPGALTVISGNNQTLTLGTASAPMVIELRANGVPLQSANITWSASGGTLANTSTATNSSGRASTTVTPNASGAMTVTASFPAFNEFTGTSITFTHNTTIASLPDLPTDSVAVAVALDSACGNLQAGSGLTAAQQDLLNQCRALGAAAAANPAAVAVAIEEMLPDVAQTQSQSSQAASNAQFDNLTGRISALRAGAQGASFNGLALAASGGKVSLMGLGSALLADEGPTDTASESFGRWGFFMSGTIGRGEADAGSLTPSYDFDVNGITAGVDYRKNDSLVLGVAMGYTSQDTTLAGGQGSVDMSGISLSLYSTWYQDNSWYMDSVISLSRNSYDSTRLISFVLPLVTVNQLATAASDGNDVNASVTFGRDFNKDAMSYGFYGRVMYGRQSYDGFSEAVNASLPGAGLALSVSARDVNSLSSVLGGKVSFTNSTSWGVLVPVLEAEWQKEYRSDPESFRAFFLNDPTQTPIIVTGEALDSSFFRLGAGLSAVLTKGRSGFVMYERIFGRDRISQDSLALGFRVEF